MDSTWVNKFEAKKTTWSMNEACVRKKKANGSRLRGLRGVIRLFHGLHCEIVIFPNGKVMVSQPIPFQKDVSFSKQICH